MVEWRPVVGHEEWYEVSDGGQVRSWKAMGAGHRRSAEPRLIGTPQPGMYPRVMLWKDGTGTLVRIHVLVLEAFRGPRPAGLQSGHMNGIRSDNRLENLRWITVSENMSHRFDHGTAPSGEDHPWAVLTSADVREIRVRLGGGQSYAIIAKDYGVTRGAVGAIARGRTWRHVA